MKRNLIWLMALFVFPSAIYAGGYRVSLQGIRQAALGAQGTVLTHDASVAFFNPGALVFVEGKFSASLGVFGTMLDSKYQNIETGETHETENPVGTPIYGAVSYKPIDNLAIGVSFSTPYGSTLDWGPDWGGRYVIDRIELKAYFLQPTISYKFNDWFGVGVGYLMASGEVNIQKQVAIGNTDGSLELSSTDASGRGFSLGAYMLPTDKLKVGISYRSKVDMEAEDGDAIFTNIPSLALANPKAPFRSTKFDSELPLPYEAALGLSYQVTPKLLLAGEVISYGWEQYESLDIQLHDLSGDEEVQYDIVSTQNYDHSYSFSLGAEYAATDMFDLRLGYKFDNTPSPSAHFNPQTPTVDYHAYTAGLGAHLGNFHVDIMGEYLSGVERRFDNIDSGLSGDIVSKGLVFGLGLSYNLK